MLGARRLTPVGYASDARAMPAYVVNSGSGTVTVSPTPATLHFTGGTPTVTVGNNISVSPAQATLTFTPGTPTVTVTNHVTVSPTPAVLTFSTSTPVIDVGEAEPLSLVGQTYAIPPSNDNSAFIIGTFTGEVLRVNLDWEAKAAFNDTAVETVSWSVVSGTATLSSSSYDGNITSSHITTASAGNSTIKVMTTFEDGQIDIAVIKVKTSAIN